MILSARTIQNMMILDPFVSRQTDFMTGLTYGCGAASYDVRAEFLNNAAYINMVPGAFILASTIERFTMPYNVAGIVHDKSTWARRGLCVQNTFLDPGWAGYLTLELTNHSQQVLRLTKGIPIAQIVFHFTDIPTLGYTGKYQDQERGPQQAR